MQGCTLFISDIHADIGALEAILRLSGDEAFTERYGHVERVLNLGDVVQRGYNPCEVIDRMKGIPNLTSVVGNHDEAFVWSVTVSGSDARSMAANEMCHRRGGWQGFFQGMPVFHIDKEERLYAVHGGPLNPVWLCDGLFDQTTMWLNSQTWQRISRSGRSYFDMNGYHYTPEQAFDAVRDVLGCGFAIICGHEHVEAAFAEKEGKVEDILYGLEMVAFAAGSRRVEEKKIVLRDETNYLVRLGIAGPAGYYERYGWDRCYFGVYHKEAGQRCISMLSFPLGRGAVPP
jgi:hypothetical protein